MYIDVVGKDDVVVVVVIAVLLLTLEVGLVKGLVTLGDGFDVGLLLCATTF